MPCEEYRELIQRFIDGELDEQERNRLRSHCMTCEACAAYLRDMLEISRTVKQMAPEELPEGLHEKLLAIPKSERRKPARIIRIFAGVTAAMVVLAVGVGFGMNRGKWSVEADAATTMVTTAATMAAPITGAAMGEDSAQEATTAAPAMTYAVAATATALTQAATTCAPGEEVIESTVPLKVEGVVESGLTVVELKPAIDSWISDAGLSGDYGFLRVVKMDVVPSGDVDWSYVSGELHGESVEVLIAKMSFEEAENITENETIHWLYQPSISRGFNEWRWIGSEDDVGLMIIVVPQGA